MSVSNCCISQGSVATYLRCGGNYYTRFVGSFFLFTAVQEFLKSVKIWQSYCQSSGPQFFWDTVYKTTRNTTRQNNSNRPKNLCHNNLPSRINSFKVLKEILGQSTMLHFADNFWRETEHTTQTAMLSQQTRNCTNIEQITEIHTQLLKHWHIEQ